MGIKSLVSPSAWKERLVRYRRVISVARKPDKEEFFSSAKVTIFGIVFMGTIGFIVFLMYQLILIVMSGGI